MDWITVILGETGHLGISKLAPRAALIFVERRIFGKWAALDILVSIVVGSNLSRALTGNAPLLGTLTATTLLIVLHWVLAHRGA